MISDQSRLKAFREHLGLSRKDLATLFERSYQAIKDIEDGKSTIGVEHIKKLSDKYRLNPNWLITGEGEMIRIVQSDEPKEGYKKSDLGAILELLSERHPDSKELIENLSEKISELTQERDELMRKLLGMHEELRKLYKEI